MTLFTVLEELNSQQLNSIRDILNIKANAIRLDSSFAYFELEEPDKFIRKNIRAKLVKFYNSRKNEDINTSFRIVSLWRDYIYELIQNKKVPANLKKDKQDILDRLDKMRHRKDLDDDNKVEDLVRDILLLLWRSSNPKEQDRFIKAIRQDLDNHAITLTNEEIKKILTDMLLGAAGSAVPLAIPIIASVMLQRLTQGFIAWILISLLGQKAFQVAALGALAGPIGWVVSGGLFAAGAITAAVSYAIKKEDIEFIQAIFSIYSYRFQNRIS
jgi:hypothetical protein